MDMQKRLNINFFPAVFSVPTIICCSANKFTTALAFFLEAKKKYRFEVLTEEEHILNKENWNLLYEHLCLV
jgi:hypothetical protein